MAKPLIVKISGPTASKSGHTDSQYVATVVGMDGSVRYLTWSAGISPDELADSIKEAWQKRVDEISGSLISQAAGQRFVDTRVLTPAGSGAAEDRPAPTGGQVTEALPTQAPPATTPEPQAQPAAAVPEEEARRRGVFGR